MPNHTKNRLTFAGPDDQLGKVLDLVANDEGFLDFDNIAPCPPILLNVISPVRRGENGRIIVRKEGEQWGQREATPEEQAEYDRVKHEAGPSMFASHGDAGGSWYEWCLKHWGTKWNAYGQEPYELEGGQLEFVFHTAWCAPDAYYTALLRKVREIAPNVTVHATARYEDDGYAREIVTIDGEAV